MFTMELDAAKMCSKSMALLISYYRTRLNNDISRVEELDLLKNWNDFVKSLEIDEN